MDRLGGKTSGQDSRFSLELGVIRRGGENRRFRNGRVKRGVNETASYEHIILISIVSRRISERETINERLPHTCKIFNYKGDQLCYKKSASDCT